MGRGVPSDRRGRAYGRGIAKLVPGELPRHRSPAVLPPHLRRLVRSARTDHHATIDLLHHVPRQHVVQEERPRLLRPLQHHVTGGDDFGGKRRAGTAFEVAVGEAEVAGAKARPGTERVSTARSRACWSSSLTPSMISPSGFRGQTSAFWRYCWAFRPQTQAAKVWLPQPRRPSPTVSMARLWIGQRVAWTKRLTPSESRARAKCTPWTPWAKGGWTVQPPAVTVASSRPSGGRQTMTVGVRWPLGVPLACAEESWHH